MDFDMAENLDIFIYFTWWARSAIRRAKYATDKKTWGTR